MTIVAPRYKVEISFVSAPLSASPTFVDVSADVRQYEGIPVRYGRPDAYSEIQTATASFTLDNSTGKYTPDNTGSTYYPNVKRGRAVRITATEDGVTYYPRFYGFIDTINVVWDGTIGKLAAAQITCVDMLSLLANVPLADNVIAQAMLAPGAPNEWWTFGDPEGTTIPANSGTTPSSLRFWNEAYLSGGTITFGTATGPATDGLTAVEVNKFGFRRSAGGTYRADPNGITISGFIRADNYDPVNSAAYIMSMYDEFSDIILLWVPQGLGGVARLTVYNIPGTGVVDVALTGTTNVLDGSTHHVAATVLSAGGSCTFTLYVDGLSEATQTVPGSNVINDFPVWSVAAEGFVSSDPTTYTFAHIALWNDILTPAEILAIADAGLNGYDEETSAARLTRVAAYWNVSPTVVPTIIGTPGTQHMAPLQDIQGRTILDLMLEVVDTEQGFLYVSQSGVLTLRTRLALYNQTAAVTLPNGSVQPSLSFLQDRANLLNDVTATAAGSNYPQQVTNSTSIADNGLISEQKTLQTTDDTEALAYAQWRVGDGTAKTRSSAVDIDLFTQQTQNPTLLTAFWQLDLGELITLTGLPPAAPSTSISLLVQGIEENLATGSYMATITTSAAPAGAWKLQDATLGVLNSTTILGY